MEVEEKICTRCKNVYPLTTEYFYRHSRGKGGLRPDCKDCCAKLASNHYEKNKEDMQRYHREYNRNNKRKIRDSYLIRHYDISLEDYETMFDTQNGMCAVCSTTEPGGTNNTFMVDHDTGKVRGLLCDRCNRIVVCGIDIAIKENLLNKALIYLETQLALL